MRTPAEHAYPTHWEADVVLRDGGTARIRPITAQDAERLVSFYEQVSDESKYYRFFAPYPRLSDRDVHRFTHHDYVDRVGLAAVVGGEFIATVRYDRIDASGRAAGSPADEAEVAFLVQDAHQGRGVASALLEHIAAVARERGIRRFAAEVLPANTKMIKVFTDAGYTQKRSFEDGVVRLEFDLEPTEQSLAVMRGREQRAEARSVQRLLTPGSVAVIGVGRRPGGIGRTVLHNLLEAGFKGPVHAVNHAFAEDLARLDPEDVPAHRSVLEIEGALDLAVIAVPAPAVPSVVAQCGEHGVQGLIVLSSGYAESGPEGRERQRELLRQARSYGMRIIGPNAFGVMNTADARLNASLSPELPTPGRLGLFTQSGAIGIALLSALHRRGAGRFGISTFVSAGNRADVSGNDLLQYWHEDPDTDVALMYLESIGNPRKFTRLARRTAAAKPVVVVKGARHSGSAPTGHAVPTTRMPDATVSALLRQAGVIRVDTVTELVDAGLLLAAQPLPAGSRVAILGNSESLGLLTYDACLTEQLRPLSPRDLTTAATPKDFRAALATALADDLCDAVVVNAIPYVGEEEAPSPDFGQALGAALRAARAETGISKPVAVVDLEIGGLAEALSGSDTGAGSPGDDGRDVVPGLDIPTYPAAERAVRALAEAARYADWKRQSAEPGRVPEYEDIEESAAGDDIARLLAAGTGGAAGPEGAVPLPPADAERLLGRYGITVRPTLPALDADAAAEAAGRLGYPVALKTTAPHLRHRADLGGVRLDLTTEIELRRAHHEMTAALGTAEELCPVVQAMAPRGVDTVVRAAIDPAAGAVLSFGIAGAPSELLGDTGHRLVPVTDREAAALLRSVRTAPLLFGWRGAKPVDTAALEELLLRLSRLVDDHPEVVDIELEPVVVATRGVSVLGASVRLARTQPFSGGADLGPRRLPVY
ncbi:bifunctional acetate--CoA ligase family protein/GNAT family N-acetyltransferase [Streptomyces meridianus]|uniref:GNAT family N-acetyltransferase n=1 Tax=Streptomyces meridianus TaxID=2938945 RepID=A0ABT0X8I1_9ACTN|nr:bifunctional GNAT family N-acetyltransferase/acetate--CoA ligase family protein [Streptomyces meridianus]MCM2578844.1 GNAT family N-acetyltransferase [Streptomyces meridianus]